MGYYDEQSDVLECENCGAVVDPGVDRAFWLGDEHLLCCTCACALGGVFDEVRDTWVREPEVSDLLEPPR